MRYLPQLRMRHGLKEMPPERPVPSGFALRAATDLDAEGIARVLAESFEAAWTPGSVREALLDHPDVPATFVIERGGEVVATASYQVQPLPDPDAGWVHWVGVRPDARGLSLGEIVSRRVLLEAADARRTCVFLTTDDPRLAAIRTYLRLGFEPDAWHASHPDRWRTIREALAGAA